MRNLDGVRSNTMPNHTHILVSIIRDTFMRDVGKHQLMNERNPSGEKPKALRIRFKTSIDHDKEQGYRFLDAVIYAPMNYVQVWVRKSWNVIPIEDLEYDDEGDACIKPGKDYIEGSGPWEMIADHDSGWTDAIRDIFNGKYGNILTFSSLGHWYEIVPFETLDITEAK